jgi:cytosine/creatinine deaminase
MDIIIQNALLDKTMQGTNIGIENGVISKISKGKIGEAKQTFDAQGNLVVPPFFESHFHLDNTLLWGDVNQSGTLREAIELYARRKEIMDIDDIVERASETLRMCLANGVTWVRSHVDIDDIGQLKLLEGVKAAKEKFAGIVDVQIIAFPQHGMVRDPETVELMYAAMESGADIVGGIPHFERDMDEAARHIEIAFEIAKKFDADIDMHVDEVDDPNWYSVELLAEKTIEENYQGRVAAGHCCSMAAWDDDKFQRIIPKIKAADLNIITNVLTNLVGQGRGDKAPARRGVPPLNKLIQAGINIASGTDDMLNMFYPFGNMNPLEAINFAAHAGYLTTPELIEAAFDMPLYNAAKTFRINDYGIHEGRPANMCILPVDTKVDAIRMHPAPTLVMREGNVLVQTDIRQKFDTSVPE